MKILGIGVDIIENKRIEKSIKSQTFKKRIYTIRELKQSEGISNKTAFFKKASTAGYTVNYFSICNDWSAGIRIA